MKDTDDNSENDSQLPSPTDSRIPTSFREWGHRSQLQGVGLTLSGFILLEVISGYRAGEYESLALGALIGLFVVVFAISFPYQILSPTDEPGE